MSDKSKVPALTRCMDILTFLEKHKKSSIKDIVTELHLPKSSTYLLIAEMQRQGLVSMDSRGRLQLWMRLIEFGSFASQNIDLRDKIAPQLDTLMDSVDCLAAHYGIMDGDKAYYVIKKESPRASMRVFSREGLPVSLVHAGLGKCLLAYQSEAKRERILPALDYTAVSATSITTAEDLRRELADIRLKGWAFDNSEGEADIRCVAAPVLKPNGELMGAISIVGTVFKFSDDYVPEVVEKTKLCAQNIECALFGHQG